MHQQQQEELLLVRERAIPHVAWEGKMKIAKNDPHLKRVHDAVVDFRRKYPDAEMHHINILDLFTSAEHLTPKQVEKDLETAVKNIVRKLTQPETAALLVGIFQYREKFPKADIGKVLEKHFEDWLGMAN